MAILVRTGAAWVVSARAGREGHLSPLGGNLGENDSASWWKTTGAIALQRVGAASWDEQSSINGGQPIVVTKIGILPSQYKSLT